MTRIDIAFAVAVLSRALATPRQCHMTAARRILRYLAHTYHYALIFQQHISDATKEFHQHPIIAYTDASYANNNDRKSTTGNIVKLFGNTICWQSKKQACVSLSSTEAEYYALSRTVMEVIWFQRWMSEVLDNHTSALVLCDNKAAIALTQHDAIHQRSKHIDISYHFLRDHIKQKTISCQWIETAKEEADVLTKAITNVRMFTNLIGKNLDITNTANSDRNGSTQSSQ
jgi:hypothetical protein